MSSPATVKRNDLIDLFRFISSIFVVFIHCPFPGLSGTVITSVGRYAVPFFLLLSGWFSYFDDRDKTVIKAKKKFKNTLQLIPVFFLVYFSLYSLGSIVTNGNPLAWMADYWDLGTLVEFLLFNRAPFFGATGYYVFMLIYVYIIFLFCIRHDLQKLLLYATPVLLIVNILLGKFSDLPWFTYGNFLFTGIPFFCLGYFLHKFQYALSGLKPTTWIGILVLGFLLTLLEALVIKPAYCHVGSVLMASALLMIPMHKPYTFHIPIGQYLQRYSLYIFIVHCIVKDCLYVLLQKLGIPCSQYVFPFAVIAISLLTCVAWDVVISFYRKHITKTKTKTL